MTMYFTSVLNLLLPPFLLETFCLQSLRPYWLNLFCLQSKGFDWISGFSRSTANTRPETMSLRTWFPLTFPFPFPFSRHHVLCLDFRDPIRCPPKNPRFLVSNHLLDYTVVNHHHLTYTVI